MLQNTQSSTRSLVMCGLFSALIAIGAFIKIPFGIVPMTFQLLFCLLAGLLLGSKQGATSVFLYIFIGLVGFPVFAKGGGPQYIFQPTFGYLCGFGVGTFLTGWLAEKFRHKNLLTYLLSCFVCVVVVYSIGLPYLYMILKFYLQKEITLSILFKSYCLVFLPTDLFSCIIASLVAQRTQLLRIPF